MAKIVFCEDEEKIKKLIRITLRVTEHEIYIASDGVEGLELIEQTKPDLIFADISMPRCDGLQLVDTLKSRPHLAQIPVVFMTAFAQRTEIEEGYRRGAISYLVKPFSPADLREKIDSFMISEKARH